MWYPSPNSQRAHPTCDIISSSTSASGSAQSTAIWCPHSCTLPVISFLRAIAAARWLSYSTKAKPRFFVLSEAEGYTITSTTLSVTLDKNRLHQLLKAAYSSNELRKKSKHWRNVLALLLSIYNVCKVFCSILTNDDFVENLQSQLLSLFYSNFELQDIPRNLFSFIKTSIVAMKVSN